MDAIRRRAVYRSGIAGLAVLWLISHAPADSYDDENPFLTLATLVVVIYAPWLGEFAGGS